MKKYVVSIKYKDNDKLVVLVKTNNIEKYMNEYVRDIIDLIEGYEYQQIRHIKRNSDETMYGGDGWVGVECIKENKE